MLWRIKEMGDGDDPDSSLDDYAYGFPVVKGN